MEEVLSNQDEIPDWWSLASHSLYTFIVDSDVNVVHYALM